MRVLIVGLGSIARKHIDALKNIDKSVVLFALRSNQNAEKINEVINIYSYDDIYKLNLDFVILSNPTGCHFQSLNQLKELRLPLFIEKPLFDKTGNEQDELVDNIINNNLPTYVACNLRFLDSIVKIKEIIQTERVNEVNVYCGSYLPDWRPNVDYKSVYSANKEMGGGVHLDLIHELDYVYWLFGKPEQTKSVFRNNSSLNITAYDYANYQWEYDKFAASIVLNYYRKDPKRSLEIVCDSGIYYVDLLLNKILYNDKALFESSQRITDTYSKQMDFFIHQVLQNNDKFNSIEQANNILKLCLAD
jgi:predicted dehydrogenase